MQFGVVLPNFGSESTPENLRSTAQAAERLGFDSIWTTDHLLLPPEDASRYGTIQEALLTLAHLSAVTERIKLGVSSLVLPQRDPVLVAKQIAALDSLSGGRCVLCVSVGWSRGEYRNLGQDFGNRGARLDEAINVLRALWACSGEDPVRFQGHYYTFDSGIFAPPPAQSGGPPIWIGGNSDAAMRRAARLGDVWHPTSLPLDRFQLSATRFRSLDAEGERRVSLRMRLSYDPEAGTPLHGSPARVAQELLGYREAGLSHAVIDFGGKGQRDREARMARFMEEVVPRFREGA